jgi:hypothetical protein
MSIDGQRARTAILIPLVVFSAAAAVAIAIGMLLHLVPHGSAPAIALLLVLLITAAGFVTSARGGDGGP